MDVVSLLDRPTYLYAEADRLLGLPGGTCRRWINGYRRGDKVYPPVIRESAEATEWVRWGEFVEARMLAEFRGERVPMRRLRAAVAALREQFQVPYPLATSAPYLAAQGGRLVLEDDVSRVDLLTGQRLLETGRRVFDAATVVDDRVTELRPDLDIPIVRLNPARMGGEPTIAGRRLSVATIAGMVQAGEPVDVIARDYELSGDDVRAAVEYARRHRLLAA